MPVAGLRVWAIGGNYCRARRHPVGWLKNVLVPFRQRLGTAPAKKDQILAKAVKKSSTKVRAKGTAKEKPRRPRVTHIADLIGGTMADMLRKRGFASSDLVTNWRDIIPSPYNQHVVPDRLKWPRQGDANAGGILHVRVSPAHALGLQHDAPLLMSRINGYFGFELVRDIRAMQIPLVREKTNEDTGPPPLSATEAAARRQDIATSLEQVEDGALKDALRRLGTSLYGAEKK